MTGRNHCAQAALAAALTRFGQPTSTDAIDARFPPDTPFRLAGTTPWGLRRFARRLGLRATLRWGRPDPIRPTLDAGGLVILLVDLRPLGHPRFAMHYTLAHHADDEGVALHNAPRDHVDWDTLLSAWKGAPLPGYRYGALHLARGG